MSQTSLHISGARRWTAWLLPWLWVALLGGVAAAAEPEPDPAALSVAAQVVAALPEQSGPTRWAVPPLESDPHGLALALARELARAPGREVMGPDRVRELAPEGDLAHTRLRLHQAGVEAALVPRVLESRQLGLMATWLEVEVVIWDLNIDRPLFSGRFSASHASPWLWPLLGLLLGGALLVLARTLRKARRAGPSNSPRTVRTSEPPRVAALTRLEETLREAERYRLGLGDDHGVDLLRALRHQTGLVRALARVHPGGRSSAGPAGARRARLVALCWEELEAAGQALLRQALEDGPGGLEPGSRRLGKALDQARDALAGHADPAPSGNPNAADDPPSNTVNSDQQD